MEKCKTVTLFQLREYVSSGFKIIWVGYSSEEEVLIRLTNNSNNTYVYFNIEELKPPSNPVQIKHNEATSKPLSFVSITWQKRGWLRTLRVASIYGINVGSTCFTGLGNVPKTIESK